MSVSSESDRLCAGSVERTSVRIPAWAQARAVQAATDLRQVASRGGGSVTQGPDAVTVAGLPGFRFQLSGIQEGSTRVDGRLILAFQGRTEYLILCQHTPQFADQVESACDQILRTFRQTAR